jgi:squalene-hopene/tetraprenyl-beta-curcumene cyclase
VETLLNARRELLARHTGDHWDGHLASSALATATAVVALAIAGSSRKLIAGGLDWIVAHQNPDGGWGDTIASPSNISTTMLCWAACGMPESGKSVERTVGMAERFIVAETGSLAPDRLAQTIAAHYGKDRTFSVPIVMTCALAGRLGPDPWRLVPQLPFELAALPHQLFSWLRLPVVSYALPALVAIGQVRHSLRPTRNPVARLLRDRSRDRTLRILEQIQPASGGFLEAVPLTSFVVMALAAGGRTDHAVVRAGVRFLAASARGDGSWPIDSNLATWVTTLSVNALACGDGLADAVSSTERHKLIDWLLAQQWLHDHPYTHVAPGGWAWTNLSGGVPDADDTAGALIALKQLHLAASSGEANVGEKPLVRAAERAVGWLVSLQNSDGGIPTFCRGWGHLPFDRSGPDLTAHAIRAWSAWRSTFPLMTSSIDRACGRGVGYLRSAQRPDGAWCPLWFGNQAAPNHENLTYGTSRVLLALHEASDVAGDGRQQMAERGFAWLLAAQNSDGGWGGARSVVSSVEETALAVDALATIAADARATDALTRGLAWLHVNTDHGCRFTQAPIGLYFARLWYSEELYPLIFTVGALERVRRLGDAHSGS